MQNALGAQRLRREFVRAYVAASPGTNLRILDVGCGTAEIIPHLPPCTYVGVDLSAAYIDAARARFGDRGTFYCLDVTDPSTPLPQAEFDLAIMTGLLHHLDDEAAARLLSSVGKLLGAAGRLLTIDPSVAAKTHPVGKFLVSKDRGQHVRSPEGYQRLAEASFGAVKVHVRHDLLHVPYTHAILECSSPLARGA